jgi:hypothetical protein
MGGWQDHCKKKEGDWGERAWTPLKSVSMQNKVEQAQIIYIIIKSKQWIK